MRVSWIDRGWTDHRPGFDAELEACAVENLQRLGINAGQAIAGDRDALGDLGISSSAAAANFERFARAISEPES
jgi:hypothetical protein